MSAQSFEGTGPASDEDPGVPVSGMSIERILIVEDNWLVAIEMEAALSDAGYQVIGIAMSADQAVQLCETERPDAVLMDVRLQGQRDGVDAAIEVRARFGIRSGVRDGPWRAGNAGARRGCRAARMDREADLQRGADPAYPGHRPGVKRCADAARCLLAAKDEAAKDAIQRFEHVGTRTFQGAFSGPVPRG